MSLLAISIVFVRLFRSSNFVIFFCYWVVGILYIFWTLTLYQIGGLQRFSPILKAAFDFVDGFLMWEPSRLRCQFFDPNPLLPREKVGDRGFLLILWHHVRDEINGTGVPHTFLLDLMWVFPPLSLEQESLLQYLYFSQRKSLCV